MDTTSFSTLPIPRLLRTLAWPSLVSLLASNLYSIIDRVFVGQFVGLDALSAVSLAYPLSLLVIGFAIMIGAGTSSLVSIALGKRDQNEAQNTLSQGIAAAVIAAVVCLAIFLPFTTNLLKVLGTPDANMADTSSFFYQTLWGLPVFLVSMAINPVLRSLGRARAAMLFSLLGVVVNAILCMLFVGAFRLGLSGSAWATSIAQTVSGLAAMAYLRRTPLRLRLARLKASLLLRIASIGVGQFVVQFVNFLLFTLLNAQMLAIGGAAGIAVIGITNTLGSFMFIPVLAVGQGAMAMFGYFKGEGNAARLQETYRVALRWSILTFGVLLVCVEIFALPLMRMFIGESALAAFGANVLRGFIAASLLYAFPMVLVHFMMATARPLEAVGLILVRPIILCAAIVPLSAAFGLTGLVLSGPIADLVSFALALVLRPKFKAQSGAIAVSNPLLAQQ